MSRLSKWASSAGPIAIKDMEMKHLYNLVRVVHGYAKDRSQGYDSMINERPIHEWLADFQREIDRRSKIAYSR